MADYWMKMFQVDPISSTLIIVLCLAGSAILKSMTPTPALAIIAAPISMFSAFAVYAGWRDYGITLGAEKILDVAAAAGVGMTLGAVTTIVLYRAILAVSAR